eukprot:TRINITY_DN97_c0_g1_i5.p1 TRINITY_DN97_c0_g1~~TRINITY_DN97_c0_g1_i5.p1  ORF type:complete len:270 (-),score=106.08 TRINITY_DN97_c0_g1_i5:674-1483(-)
MPSISYEKYAKIAGIDTAKTSEKEQKKAFDQMKDQSFSDFFGQYGSEGLNHFTVVELKEELTAQGLETKGVKADLISRLEQHYGKESSHKRKSPERDAGDKKHQKTDSSMEVEVDTTGKNPGNVAGGYKATLHNPNASDEAKEKAQQVLEEMGVDPEEKADRKDRSEPAKEEGDDQSVDEMDLLDKDNKRVIGGYKATLHNPNASDEAKEKAQQVLEEMGVDPEEKADRKDRSEPAKEEGDDQSVDEMDRPLFTTPILLRKPKSMLVRS